jgi:hypothetical protein
VSEQAAAMTATSATPARRLARRRREGKERERMGTVSCCYWLRPVGYRPVSQSPF